MANNSTERTTEFYPNPSCQCGCMEDPIIQAYIIDAHRSIQNERGANLPYLIPMAITQRSIASRLVGDHDWIDFTDEVYGRPNKVERRLLARRLKKVSELRFKIDPEDPEYNKYDIHRKPEKPRVLAHARGRFGMGAFEIGEGQLIRGNQFAIEVAPLAN